MYIVLIQDVDFNPRIPQGMRLTTAILMISSIDFNPRIPQGMRQAPTLIAPAAIDFNPRIPQGMRPLVVQASQRVNYNFNPRIPQGMRQQKYPTFHRSRVYLYVVCIQFLDILLSYDFF